MRILVVENDPFICEFVVEVLREEGYDVVHASNGEDALAWCKRQAADVLITDIRLPGQVDGWQIAERCREHDPELPVIYATWIFAGIGPSRPGKSLFTETLSSGRDRAGRKAGDEDSTSIAVGVSVHPYRCGC